MYPISKLAGIVPMAVPHEQLSITEDIRRNGQHEPAVLWRGDIVDGRCRQLACVTLGIELKVKTLDSELTEDEVKVIVKALNTRRNMTDTQKAMSGFKIQEEAWETNEEIALRCGVPLGTYKNARYIGVNRPDLVDPLFDGASVKVLDPDKGFVITTNKINTLARIIKKTKEQATVVVDVSEEVTFSAVGNIKTEAGKEWYYSRMAQLGIPNTQYGIRMDYVEFANLKFKEVHSE